jgi:hypothetical protein
VVLSAYLHTCGPYIKCGPRGAHVVCTNVDAAVHDRRHSRGSLGAGRRVAADLRGNLGINPNRAGNGSVHLLVTLNTDPWSVVEQRVGQRKREGVVGRSMSAGIENPCIGAAAGCRHVRRVSGWH